ncbi:MAG: hypothetical protein OEY79_04490 [Anaplasmataceae bacterium]|nr:hypothetical protein [Anaplasmataceae bacterium]
MFNKDTCFHSSQYVDYIKTATVSSNIGYFYRYQDGDSVEETYGTMHHIKGEENSFDINGSNSNDYLQASYNGIMSYPVNEHGFSANFAIHNDKAPEGQMTTINIRNNCNDNGAECLKTLVTLNYTNDITEDDQVFCSAQFTDNENISRQMAKLSSLSLDLIPEFNDIIDSNGIYGQYLFTSLEHNPNSTLIIYPINPSLDYDGNAISIEPVYQPEASVL